MYGIPSLTLLRHKIPRGILSAEGALPETAIRELEVGSAGKGIEWIFRDIPDYDGIDSLWALSMGELNEYIPSRVVVHLSDVL